MRILLGLFFLAVACGDAAEASAPIVEVPMLDRALHRQDIQPMMERLCAQTACHGKPERGLFIYARLGARMPGSTQEPELSDEELAANVVSLSGQLEGLTALLDSPLLNKPLRPEAGGLGHQGGAQFFDRGDPGYVLLACWILGGHAQGDPTCRP